MTAARQPAFWRVVRVREGVREYLTFDFVWLLLGCYARPFPVLSEANALAKSARGRAVPVYVTVRKVDGPKTRARKAVIEAAKLCAGIVDGDRLSDANAKLDDLREAIRALEEAIK